MYILQCIYYMYFKEISFMKYFLAHLSWKLKWAFLSPVVRRLSVRPSVCRLSVGL